MHVDRVGVELKEGAGFIQCADHVGPVVRLLDNGVGDIIDVPQADLGRRVALPPIVVPPVDLADLALLLQNLQHRPGEFPHHFALFTPDGQLLKGAAYVPHRHVGIVRIHGSMLGGLAKEVLGLSHQELVDRGILTDEEHNRLVCLAAGTPRLLPHARDGPRVTDHDGCIQAPYVDPQFECVGAHHAQQLALKQHPLDLAPLAWQVPAPIRPDRPRKLGADP